MIDLGLWFLVICVSGIAVTGLVRAVEKNPLVPGDRRSLVRCGRLAGAAALGIVALALLWRIRGVAGQDAQLVQALSHSRNAVLTDIFSVVTTMGDAIPTLTLATVLSILASRQTGHRVLAWILPVVIIVEVTIQALMTQGLHDYTVAMFTPDVHLGGVGAIPSGSMARLFSLFLVAAILWRSANARMASRLASIGSVLIMVELVSRMYLGRHLHADIAAGLLLGVVLTMAASAVVLAGRSLEDRLASHRQPRDVFRAASDGAVPASVTSE